MPAYFEQGFSVREPSWHQLEVVLDEYPGREEAMQLAGHDFTVIERDLYMPPVELPEDGSVDLTPVSDWKALARDDRPEQIFQVVKDSYTIVQNDTMWDIVDGIIDQPNVRYETAGVLKGGAILWVLAWLDEPQTVPGDDSPIYPWACVSTTHDGSGACVARSTSIRVVCWNTFSMAEAEASRSGREFTFRHTKNVDARIEDAKLALKGVREDANLFMELATELAKMPVKAKGVEYFVTQFIPTPPEALISDRVVGNIEQAREKVRAILGGKTVGNGNGPKNAWDLLQAGTEYLDHIRGFRSSDTLFGRQLLRTEPFKAKLIPLVREASEISVAV